MTWLRALGTATWNVLVAISKWLNAALGPMLNILLRVRTARFGDPLETLSSVLGRNVEAGECSACRLVCRLLDLLDYGHCIKNIQRDRGGS